MKTTTVAVTVLADNARGRTDLVAEHGLSLWIETDEACLLFDTGSGGALAANAERLRVPLERASAIVASHGHYDHTGGLAYAVSRARDARLFLHPDARLPRYSRRHDAPPRSIGIPPDASAALEGARDRIVWTTGPIRISDRIGLTGPIPRRSGFEEAFGDFYLDPACATPDPFRDDQALWILTRRGPLVLLGCAHAGVVNTLEAVAELTGTSALCGAIGGLHLARADGERLRRTAEAFDRHGVNFLAPCHCTGESAMAFLSNRFPGRCASCAVGSLFSL
jgi:7,8-dihydropterin-6-yl-methyl-4-(beta-D-ribofuranosyl)aminobenzene 5'-phosphate synthase